MSSVDRMDLMRLYPTSLLADPALPEAVAWVYLGLVWLGLAAFGRIAYRSLRNIPDSVMCAGNNTCSIY